MEDLYAAGDREITVLDSLTEQVHGPRPEASGLFRRIRGKCRFIRGDLRDSAALRAALPGNDCVLHLAAETGTGQSMYELRRYCEANVTGTAALLEAAAEQGVKKLVLASSRAVYGEGKYLCDDCGAVYPPPRSAKRLRRGDFGMYCPRCGRSVRPLPTDEESPARPASVYACTKLAQEQLVRTVCTAIGAEYTILRFQNVYGPGQSLHNPYTGILSLFTARLLADLPVDVFEDGRESRDFIHVRDISAGVIAALSAGNGSVINLGSGQAVGVLEAAEKLRGLCRSRGEVRVTGEGRLGDIAHCRADIRRAEVLLGFRPRIALDEGLAELCRWAASERYDPDGYDRSLAELRERGMFITEA